MTGESTPEGVLAELLARFPGTVPVEAWGETSLFYNPGGRLPRGVYFATVKQKDGANDRASQLDREGVWRLNLGTTRPLFEAMFGTPPNRPAKGKAVAGPWDFTQLDRPTPHPVYGWMSWVSVLNPSRGTLASLDAMTVAAFDKARAAFDRKVD